MLFIESVTMTDPPDPARILGAISLYFGVVEKLFPVVAYDDDERVLE